MDVHTIATFHTEHYFTVKGDDIILNTCIVNMIMLNYILLNSTTIAVRIYMKSCFFIGHREADARLLPTLTEVIRQLVTEEDVRHFYAGGYGGFDQIAGIAVKEVKCQYDGILLNLVLPYHPAERSIEAPLGYDGTYYPEVLEGVPKH